MLSFTEWILVVWSVAAAGWWCLALILVWRAKGGQRPPREGEMTKGKIENITIFKPLPPMASSSAGHPSQITNLTRALESFVSQLDETSDMLIGVEEQDKAIWQPIFDDWQRKYPGARFQAIFRARPTNVANPKIAWQMHLAPRATGTLWLWSDADIVAPPDFLRAICAELKSSGTGALTSPYVVRRVGRPEGVLDVLFVNIEFYPGVLLLRKRGPVSFAFGAATLFHAAEFQRKIDWQKLGSALADDFELGKLLGPVTLGKATVETLPDQASWRASLKHYLRWNKTIRWCQPVGYAGQIAILPVLGWMMDALANPWSPVGWFGWLVASQIEAGMALLICSRVGCLIPWRWLWVIESWTVVRPLVWLASWLPLSVNWGGDSQRWWKPNQSRRNPDREQKNISA